MESLDGGFFTVRSRSGDPTTEDLHARTSQPKVCEGLTEDSTEQGDRRWKQVQRRTPLRPVVVPFPCAQK